MFLVVAHKEQTWLDGWLVVCWLDGWLFDGWMAGWLFDGWTAGWLFVGWLAGCLLTGCWLAGWTWIMLNKTLFCTQTAGSGL